MTLADLLLNLRGLGNDTATSNAIRQEVPLGKVDTSNKYYRLQNWPVVAGSLYMTVGSTWRGQNGFTVDPATGIITFTAAPTAGSNPFEADYTYYWFSDADHTTFLNVAAKMLGYTDPTGVEDGLVPALLHYALHEFWKRRSSQYANKYSSSGGTAGHSVEVVTGNFKKLAEEAFDTAGKLRDDFYKKQGRQLNPSSGVFGYAIDPYTPRR